MQGRHEAIQKIERQMIELAQLFQDVEAAVVQQEPAIEEIETKAVAINDNVGKANTEMNGAIAAARSRNRKKWWCLGISRTFLQILLDFQEGVLIMLHSAHHHHHRGRCRGCRSHKSEKLNEPNERRG